MEFCFPTTPLLHQSMTPTVLALNAQAVSPLFPLLGLVAGYALLLFFNPVRLALRDGLRCIMRFKRVWLTFVLLGFAYSVFQFATFQPFEPGAALDLNQVAAPATWNWPRLVDV